MPSRASWREVFWAFLRLGLTSFGGPIAHLGYFRTEFVQRRRWIHEKAYADLVALCQFLPGPASSQVAFGLGLERAGWRGAAAAWVGFTLPSATAMVVFATEAASIEPVYLASLTHGLQIVAVAVVAQAVVGMARVLCPDTVRALIAVASLVLLFVAPTASTQLVIIIVGAAIGYLFCQKPERVHKSSVPSRVSPTVGNLAVMAFLILLVGLPLVSLIWPIADLKFFNAFYRSGSLVFGGGHVVLPLLQDAVVASGWVSDHVFLAGYGAAQALPGPLFSFAAYLGTVSSLGPGGVLGALLALIAIFLPGMLILVAALHFWGAVKKKPETQAAIAGISAAVVGLLGFALVDPLWTSTVHSTVDFGAVTVAFALLAVWKTPPVAVVAMGVAWGLAPLGRHWLDT